MFDLGITMFFVQNYCCRRYSATNLPTWAQVHAPALLCCCVTCRAHQCHHRLTQVFAPTLRCCSWSWRPTERCGSGWTRSHRQPSLSDSTLLAASAEGWRLCTTRTSSTSTLRYATTLTLLPYSPNPNLNPPLPPFVPTSFSLPSCGSPSLPPTHLRDPRSLCFFPQSLIVLGP